MTHGFLRTLTGKTLLRLAAGGAAVVLAASLLGTYVLYRQAEDQALARLSAQAAEHARAAERLLGYTVETHQAVGAAFVERWARSQDAATARRFDALMERYPDGAWRSRREISDGRIHATGWVHKAARVDDEMRRLMVLFHELSQLYGPGAALRHDNLFFMGMPGESNMGYDPYLTPNWIFDIDERFSHLDFEWGRLAYQPAAPGERTRWSAPLVDLEVPLEDGAAFTALTPIHVGERHLATVGTTLLLKEFLARVWPAPPAEGRYLVFLSNGQLIADSQGGKSLESQIGRIRLTQLGGSLPGTLLGAAALAERAARVGYDRSDDVYYAIARIDGPGWLVAEALPGALVRSRASGIALWAMAGGFAVLAMLLAMIAAVLRRQVAAPLGALTRAAEQIAAGDASVRLPATRDDELGRLALAFNDMAAKVSERDAALRQDKQRIEQALTSLRLTEERWRGMTDNASDLIAVVGPDGRFSYVSPPVEKMLGIRAQDLVGQNLHAWVHPDDAAALGPRPIEPGSAPLRFRARHADGRWRVLEALTSDQRSHPAVGGVVLNIRDVSEIVAAEEELRRQRESLHQSEKLSALGGLLAGVAHELNNPLAIVVGRASQLERRAQSTEDRDTAQKIRAAAERCARIVRTFLAMARRQEAVRTPTDINGVIADAIDVLAYTLQSGGVEIDTELATNLPPVLGDAGQLGQVFMNLFTNAQQAMAHNTGPRRLTVRTRAQPGIAQLRVEVADSGPGVPPEVGSRIFEPFFTTKPIGEGTGVGLAVSLGLVQAHGGTLHLASTPPGSGACFVVTLPTLRAAAPAPDAAAALPAGPAGAGLHVLVVDDEVEIAELLQEILNDAGHRVALAHDGAAALERLGAERFDAVFTDLKMPGMDGPALYREIQRRHPALAPRVIAVTGDTLGTAAHEFVRASGVPVVDKPFEPEEILRELGRVVSAARD